MNLRLSLAAGLLIASTSSFSFADEIDLSQYYGFQPLELFKLADRSSAMLSGDLNGDGKLDIVVADNSHSRLDLLIQRGSKPADGNSDKQGVNEIGNDWRFEHRKLAVDRSVTAMVLGDFNGDRRQDIACLGEPNRLVIRLQPESGDWTEKKEMRLADVSPSPWCMASGDLNGDARDDIVVLGSRKSYLLYQQEDGSMGTPQGLLNTSANPGLVQVTDLDGDGRKDLCYLAGSDERAFCARLQSAQGGLEPELRFDVTNPRAIALHNLDGKPGQEVLSIDGRTGRVRVSRVTRAARDATGMTEQLVQYGLGDPDAGKDRDLATGDLDGDGLLDVVVTEPESAAMIVFRQHKESGLDLGTTYPGLLGADHVRLADFDGDGQDEVIVLSSEEKTLAISRLKAGRLTFPEALPVKVGEPLCLDITDVTGDKRPDIVFLSRVRDGRSSEYYLSGLTLVKDAWQPHTFGEESGLKIDTKYTPTHLKVLDANHDGRSDFLVFVGSSREPLLLVTNKDGKPELVENVSGIRLGEVDANAVFVGRDRRMMLVAQQNFARSLMLTDSQEWKVIDQFNTNEINAKIAGAAAMDLDGKPGDEVALIDLGVQKLRLLRLVGNVYRPWRELDLKAFAFKAAEVVDLNGDKRDDLLLFGRSRMAVLYNGRSDPKLEDVASYESTERDVFFQDLVAGDLNGDGQPEVAVIDTQSHSLEVLNFDATRGLRRALRFKIFEEKSFSTKEGRDNEPREALIADVTGDRAADLLLLCHDRLILYPQDQGGK